MTTSCFLWFVSFLPSRGVPVHAWTLFISRKFLEKIDKNCNCLCVTEKKKKQTMHVYYCTITKSKSNHGSFKPQISGIHVCIIISEAYIKNPSGLVVPGTHKGLLFICERIHTGQWPEEGWSVWNSIPGTFFHNPMRIKTLWYRWEKQPLKICDRGKPNLWSKNIDNIIKVFKLL